MQIVKNVLSEELYSALLDELKEKTVQQVWSSSKFIWYDWLKKGVSGPILTSKISDVLSNQILREIEEYVPECNEIVCQFYIWQEYSGINTHNDQHCLFGATIYLNEHWELDDGGFFVWVDKETDELKILSPEKNLMVLNGDKELHLVTPVLPSAKDFRYTVQIWGN